MMSYLHSKKAKYKPPGDVNMKEFTDDNQATLVQSTSKSFMQSEEDLATFEPSEQTSGAMEHQGECTMVSLSLAPYSHVTGTCVPVLASFSDGSSEVSSSGSLFCSCA